MSDQSETTASAAWPFQRLVALAVGLAAVCGLLFYASCQPQVEGPLQFLLFAWAFAMFAALQALLRPRTTSSSGGLVLMFLLTSLMFVYIAIDRLD